MDLKELLIIIKTLRLSVFAVALLFYYSSLMSQELPKGAIQVFPESIKWIDAPSPLPPGSQIAILEGNPKEAGMFTMRVKLPPNYSIPIHSHPKEERVTVLEGVVFVGFGKVVDTAKAQKFTAGCFYVNPIDKEHFVYTLSEGCIFQVTALGPWGINYIEDF